MPQRATTLPTSPSHNFEALSRRFTHEATSVILSHEIWGDCHNALRAYFHMLDSYVRWGDFSAAERLEPQGQLGLLVNGYILYGWFRAWLRSRGVDPDVFAPTR